MEEQDLKSTVREVELLFEQLDAHIDSVQQRTSLHCKFGCGQCCFKADIEATILEFLPFAHHLYETHQAEAWYERLCTSDQPVCMILNPTQHGAGLCSEYKHRGLICRLFGYSARTNKYGKKELVTCAIIKSEQAEKFNAAVQLLDDEQLNVPVMSEYYLRLASIDFSLSREFYPINLAMRKALEKVLSYYAYR